MRPERSQWRRAPSDESGFTLIEIAVVLIIIGILITLAVPRFTAARKASTIKSLQSAVGQYDSSIRQFMLDNGQMTPDWASTTATGGHWRADHELANYDRFGAPYMSHGKPEIMARPGIGMTLAAGAPGATSGTTTGILYYRPNDRQYLLVSYYKGNAGCWSGSAAPAAALAPLRCR